MTTTSSRPSRTGIATFACLTLLLPACEEGTCRKTETDARDAAVADAGNATSSAVLEARLTSGGRSVGGRTIVFDVRIDGRYEFAGSADTSSEGVAQLDLKDDLVELARDVRAGSYRAAFHGDGKYCSSHDVADVDLVAVP